MENKLVKVKEKIIREKEELALNCSVHPQELVIAFCDTCQKAVCFDCSRETHKDHQCSKIENKAKISKTNIPKLVTQIQKKRLPELRDILKKIAVNKTRVAKADEVIEQIHKRANELMAMIMEERDLLIEDSKKSLLAQGRYYQIEESVIQRYMDMYQTSLQEYPNVAESTNNIEIVLFESKLNSQLKDFTPRSLRNHSIPNFKTGKTDRAIIKSMLGVVECDRSFESSPTLRDELVGIQTRLVSSTRYSSTNISSFAFKENELAWVLPVESTIGAVIDIKGTEHKKFNFGFEFSDFTLTDKNIILATDTLNERIVQITNNGVVKEVLTTTPLQPHGIYSCQNGDLLVTQMYTADPKSIDSKRLVQRLSKDYSVKFAIQFTNSFFSKKHILTHPRRVAENLNGDIIVVDLLDETSGRVAVFDFVGKFRFAYEGNSKRSKFLPFDICCESELMRIIISDYYNHEIHVVTCDGQFIQDISTKAEGLLNPVAVALDYKSRIWIGGKGGKIIVFKYT